ncbi:hypothetical protein BDV93DRAFT_569328 [Ceratobasidium sp. AG-I]|nr:hypothetical protein BDV93DRAFT_569328 [Ceratobasidium sp. AG-I]
MPSTKSKTKPSATVPANDRRTATQATAEEAPNEKPKTIITYFNGGESIKITQPNGATEKWSIVHKPVVTKAKKQYNLEAAMKCGRGAGFDKPHTFYLDVRAHLRLAASSILKGNLTKEWDAVSIEEKHSVISSVRIYSLEPTKLAFPYGYRFPGDWAYEEMFKRVLRNARDTKTNKQGRRQGIEAALIVTNENEPAHEAEVDIQMEDAGEDEPPQVSNNNGNADHGNSSHGNDDEIDNGNKNNHVNGSKGKGKTRAIEEDMEEDAEEDVEEDETDEEEQFAPRLKYKKPVSDETSDEEEESEEDEPIASTIRASSSAVEIIDASQTESQSTIAPDSPVPVTTKTKGAAKKRKAPESSNTPAADPPSSSKKPRKTGPNVETSSSPLSSASPPSSRAPAPVPASTSKRTAPEAPEVAPAKKPKTQPKPKATADTQDKQKAKSNTKEAKLMSAAPVRADSWAADYQQELNALPPVKAQKKTQKKSAKVASPEPDSSTPFEPSEPSTSTAPRPLRPRPKMRPPPPPEDSPAPTITRNAKAELVEAVVMGGTKAVKNTRSRAAKGAKTG